MFTKLSFKAFRSVFLAPGATLLLGALVIGCADPETSTNLQTQSLEKGTVPPDVDILFMIDNSFSMKEEQEKLRRNFPAFVNSLRTLPGGLPNLHIGIVSSDVGAGNVFISGNPACNRPGGDKGEMQVKAGCGVDTNSGNFIISINNDTQRNFTGKLEDVFACMADLGAGGCGFEHQLQSIRVALNPQSAPANNGFLRTSAVLMVIMVTDEDDCSGPPTSSLYSDPAFEGQLGSLRCNITGHLCNGMEPQPSPFVLPLEKCTANPNGLLIPIQTIRNDLLALKPNHPERIIVSAITGMPKPGTTPTYQFTKEPTQAGAPALLEVAPICSSGADGSAAPPLRINEFVKSFGANGRLESICEGDFSPAFGRLGALLSERLMAPVVADAGTASDVMKQDAGGPAAGGSGGSTTAMDGGMNPASGTSTGGTDAKGSGGNGGAGPIKEATDDNSGCSCKVGASPAKRFNHWAGLLLAALAFGGIRRRHNRANVSAT